MDVGLATGKFAPYSAVDSGRTIKQIFAQVNEANWYAYSAAPSESDPAGGPTDRPIAGSLDDFVALLSGLLALPNVEFVTHLELLANQAERTRRGKRSKTKPIRIALRHDIDSDIVGAVEQARIESELGVVANWVVLHTAAYYGAVGPTPGRFLRHESMAPVYRSLQNYGHEVSLHADPLGLYQFHGTDGAAGMVAELEWLRSEGLEISGTTGHNHRPTYGAENYEIFTDVLSPSVDAQSLDAAGVEFTNDIVGSGVSPLRVLDRTELGLSYEGNEAFWRAGVHVEYGAVQAQDKWFWTERDLPKPTHADDWKFITVSQQRLIDEIATLPAGAEVVLVIHPEYYGARLGPDQPPVRSGTTPLVPAATVATGLGARLRKRLRPAPSPIEESSSTIGDHMAAVTVIDFRSLSYTGTTWLNLLAGSHADVFSLVLPQRVYAALRGELDPDRVCMLHQTACPFWPAAIAAMDPSENLYLQLAQQAGTSHLVLNNPFVDPQGLTDLDHPDVTSRTVTIVRDPRAMAASYLARNDATVDEAISWVVDNAYLADPAAGRESVRFRYEDVVADQRGFLSKLGDFVGLDYGADAVRFWEHEHHPAGGNGGPFNLISRHGLGVPAADPMIEQRYERVCADPLDVANPEKWRQMLSEADLGRLRAAAAGLNENWGYSW